jgi:hypothetical protein
VTSWSASLAAIASDYGMKAAWSISSREAGGRSLILRPGGNNDDARHIIEMFSRNSSGW